MNYIAVANGFGIENLVARYGQKPEPGEDEILVRMKAASLNYVDLAVVNGWLEPKPALPFVPVADGAGVIEDVGKRVHGFRPGDRVATLYIPSWPGGRYLRQHTPIEIRPGAGTEAGQLSEYKVFRPQELIRVPETLSHTEAATLPIAGVTAWNALAYGRLKAGDTVLLHGTGGVSIFALQLAKASGARVAITSSDDAKLERARALGADLTLNYKAHGSLSDEVLRLTGGEGVDLVVETVGGPNLAQSLRCLRPQGHVSVVGFLAGTQASVDLISLNLQRATITGVSVGSTEDFRDLLAAMSARDIRPVIDSVFPLDQAAEAFQHLESGRHFGKIVIEL